ncbi:uncharacterized protein LOC117640999 [Thrips palmi]|uniref:Uncharacterized protein LOC117640999 n=1 Tax=Thrips palmi TaxID=161013 RepID=A0A6P8Y3A3_THRPL|nr:uncharacterized protein LOC117640999 [Thrips palmi]
MDAVIEAGVEDTGTEVEQISSDAGPPCGAIYADQQCELKEGQVLHDDGEILLVQGLQDFQGVISETVVVDEGHQEGHQQQSASMPGLPRANFGGSSSYQQYQPLVVQGFVTSSGEVVHVVQDTPPSGGHRTLNPSANLPGQTYQHPYQHQAQHQAQPQMMHPDLYRLIKMFPDFSTKTLHRIFVMCRCDLKRSLDQALFARQFRQLDSQSYSPIAPTSAAMAPPHFPAAPYRTPVRAPYMQMGVDLGDVYPPRGRASHGATAAPAPPPLSSQSSAPILLYQQASGMQPLGLGQQLPDVDDAEVVEIKLSDLSSDVQIGTCQSLGDSDSLGQSLGLGLLSTADGDNGASLGPGGDSAERGDKDADSKDVLPDLAEVTVEDSSHVTKTEPTVVC